MRNAAFFNATTPNLEKSHLFIDAYEASLLDGSIDFSGNSMKHVFVDADTKALIEQYEPDFVFGEKETFAIKYTDKYMDLYGTSSGIRTIRFAEQLLMKFRMMKAHLQWYFEQDAEMFEKTKAWGDETVETIPSTTALAYERIMEFFGYYRSVQPYNVEANKVVQRIQDDYPFDTAIYEVVKVI